MARVTKYADFTNPVKSITYIPDHYVNIVASAPTSGVTEQKAGQVVKVNFQTFADQKVNENEGTPVTVLIHGFVNAAKLIEGEKLDPNSKQITVLGNKQEELAYEYI